VWRSRAQLELATVEYVAWFNHDRLHESLGDIPPVEFEALHTARTELMTTKSANGSVVALAPRPADGLTTRRPSTIGVDFGANSPISPASALVLSAGIRSGRTNSGQQTNGRPWPLRPTGQRHTH
jgi:hypothetical protein